MSNFYGDTKFGLEVISTASFVDDDYGGTPCRVTAQVIRLNPEALTRYWAARREGELYEVETEILRLLGVNVDGGWPAGTHVTHSVAEICTVVTMQRIGGTP